MTVSKTGTNPTSFGFVGKEQYQTDGDSGLQLLGHRYYDPSIGRFLSQDPIQDGSNWYVYADNNPLGETDPEGLQGGRGAPPHPPRHSGGTPPKGGSNPNLPPHLHNPLPGSTSTGTYPGHTGWDLFAPIGTPVYSVTDGTVIAVGEDDGNKGGNRIWIQDPNGNFWYYAHLKNMPTLKPGAHVKAGATIGLSGDTGQAKGIPHLHIGVARRRGGTNGPRKWKIWHHPEKVIGKIPGVKHPN